MRAYLEKAAGKARVTVEEFAAGMSRDQAIECYEYIERAIKNPQAPANDEEDADNKLAKQFLKNVKRYETK